MPISKNTPTEITVSVENEAVPSDEEWNRLVARGRTVMRKADQSQKVILRALKHLDNTSWQLGDVAIQVRARYGEANLERYAAQIGVSYSTLRRFRWVASELPQAVRRGTLSFTHHQMVLRGSVQPKDRQAWLEQAERRHWSTREFDEALRRFPIPSPEMIEHSEEAERLAEAEQSWTDFCKIAWRILNTEQQIMRTAIGEREYSLLTRIFDDLYTSGFLEGDR